MEHRGTKRAGHVTGAAIAGQSPDSDLYAASATRPAAAPGSYLEGIMESKAYLSTRLDLDAAWDPASFLGDFDALPLRSTILYGPVPSHPREAHDE